MVDSSIANSVAWCNYNYQAGVSSLKRAKGLRSSLVNWQIALFKLQNDAVDSGGVDCADLSIRPAASSVGFL